MALHDYVEAASTAVFIASTAINVFFIYIVHTKTKQDIGNYKYVMICFAIGNIAYSLAEFISKPVSFCESFIVLRCLLVYSKAIEKEGKFRVEKGSTQTNSQ